MKLVVQVPCLNEEETLPSVLQSIPRVIDGIDEIVIVVIDDGSSDRTVEVARSLGVTHFVRHARNQGLARSFQDGVNYALEIGADIVVNTDGDNQYPQERIPDLVQPIVEGRADIVIADRQVHLVEHFSPAKKPLQKLGSRVVNRAAGTDLPDAASGFRAYSRESLMRLNMVTRFSYCMESIIQAGNKRLKIESVPVVTNAKTRESRLFSVDPAARAQVGGRDHPRLHHVQALRHLRLGLRGARGARPGPVRPVRRPGRHGRRRRPPAVAHRRARCC